MSNPRLLSNCTADTIRDAAAALKAGHLVAFPTETVYGLGGDARNADAVKRIYQVKGRPVDHPLIVHISSINQVEKWTTEVPEYAITLARNFWPGPMTLILKRSQIAKDFITGGQDTVGLRIPSDPLALALISEFEKISDSAIAAPSANRFGHVSPTSGADVFEELAEYLSHSDLILDGGNSSIGIESTIIDCSSENPRILRPGYVVKGKIEKITGRSVQSDLNFTNIKFSGSFEKHYAPRCKLIIGEHQLAGGGFFALDKFDTPSGMLRLASPKGVDEYAHVFYSTLRKADQLNLDFLIVIPPEGPGLAEAINDKLKRAALGR